MKSSPTAQRKKKVKKLVGYMSGLLKTGWPKNSVSAIVFRKKPVGFYSEKVEISYQLRKK